MGISDTSASPYWSLTKGMYWTLKSLFHVENSSCSIESQDTHNGEKALEHEGDETWRAGFHYLKFKKKGGGVNEKVITSTPGRKLRSRELKVCRFSVQACQEEKQTQPHTGDRTNTWEAAISSSSSSCSASSVGIWRFKLTSTCWENTFKSIHTAV